MSKGFDLAAIDTATASDKGFELELRHPVTNAATGVFITVLGKDSKVFKDYVRAKANERLRKDMMTRNRGKDNDPPTVEQLERDTIDLLTACTLSWRDGDAASITLGGKALEFNEANVRTVYAITPIRDQVDEAIGDMGNFLPG